MAAITAASSEQTFLFSSRNESGTL